MAQPLSPGFTVRDIPAGIFHGVRSLSLSVLVSSLRTVVLLLRHPQRAGFLAAGAGQGAETPARVNADGVSPYSLLVLSFLVSLVRLARDPGFAATTGLLGLEPSMMTVWVLLSAGGAVVGSILMPAFWYTVLRVHSDKQVFIGGMVLMYAAVVIPWDLSSVLWISVVRESGLPLWLPELVKTAIITVYCSVAGTHMPVVSHDHGADGRRGSGDG